MMTPRVGRLHVRQDSLGGKELVLQVHRDPVIPILRRDFLGRMPLVVCRIVDEDLDRSVRRARLRDARAQGRDIGQVNVLKMSGEPLAGQLPRQTDAGLVR